MRRASRRVADAHDRALSDAVVETFGEDVQVAVEVGQQDVTLELGGQAAGVALQRAEADAVAAEPSDLVVVGLGEDQGFHRASCGGGGPRMTRTARGANVSREPDATPGPGSRGQRWGDGVRVVWSVACPRLRRGSATSGREVAVRKSNAIRDRPSEAPLTRRRASRRGGRPRPRHPQGAHRSLRSMYSLSSAPNQNTDNVQVSASFARGSNRADIFLYGVQQTGNNQPGTPERWRCGKE